MVHGRPLLVEAVEGDQVEQADWEKEQVDNSSCMASITSCHHEHETDPIPLPRMIVDLTSPARTGSLIAGPLDTVTRRMVKDGGGCLEEDRP